MDKYAAKGASGQQIDYIGGRYPNDHGRYMPEDSLDAVGRAVVGITAARLHIHLHNIFVARESLEIAAGALQQALEVTHKTELEEKYRLREIRGIIDLARDRILDLRKGKKKNDKS